MVSDITDSIGLGHVAGFNGTNTWTEYIKHPTNAVALYTHYMLFEDF